MRSLLNSVTVVALAGALACGGETTAPEGALIGRWGGLRVELVSASNQTTVRFLCGNLVGSGALAVDDTGHFTHTVRSVNPPSAESLTLEGTVTGDVINFDLTAYTSNGSGSISFVVTRNAVPDFGSGTCVS